MGTAEMEKTLDGGVVVQFDGEDDMYRISKDGCEVSLSKDEMNQFQEFVMNVSMRKYEEETDEEQRQKITDAFESAFSESGLM